MNAKSWSSYGVNYMKEEMSGARILMESLRKEGVDLIFGYPGGAVLDGLRVHDCSRRWRS